MNEESRIVMRGAKVARIIESLSSLYNLSLQQATDIYYNTESSDLIEEGVADLHCRSDKYLATLVWDEYLETHSTPDLSVDAVDD